MSDPIYIGLIVVDNSIVSKLGERNRVTIDELREALQWPAEVRVALEESPEHGRRCIALAQTANGRLVLAALLPAPAWAGGDADTWVVKTAYWL